MYENSPWGRDQEFRDVPLIERTYLCWRPDGSLTEVNRFDHNLFMCAGAGEKYIQCADASWIKANRLRILTEIEQGTYLGSNSRNATELELRA